MHSRLDPKFYQFYQFYQYLKRLKYSHKKFSLDASHFKADDSVVVSAPVIVSLILKFDKVLKNNFN